MLKTDEILKLCEELDESADEEMEERPGLINSREETWQGTAAIVLRKMVEEREVMRRALEEAMEWNWLDADMPADVEAKCRHALNPEGATHA